MFYSDDPVADFERHDAEQERELDRLPVCEYCEEPIQDEFAYYIEGSWYCTRCMNENFRREVVPEYG